MISTEEAFLGLIMYALRFGFEFTTEMKPAMKPAVFGL